MKKINRRSGFTLVELLVVIGILAILTAVVLVAVNPGRQLAQARDTQRRADVNTILTAISAYMADPENKGALPAGITNLCTATPHIIGSGAGNLDIGAILAPMYVAAMPFDPSMTPVDPTNPDDTGYTVCVSSATARRITVAAPNTELATTTISVTR